MCGGSNMVCVWVCAALVQGRLCTSREWFGAAGWGWEGLRGVAAEKGWRGYQGLRQPVLLLITLSRVWRKQEAHGMLQPVMRTPCMLNIRPPPAPAAVGLDTAAADSVAAAAAAATTPCQVFK